MDEPLSNLDVALRVSTREEIRALQRQIGITTIYVTHDQSEAMSLSDRMAIMQQGRVVQIGTPAELYEHPGNAFVAEFLGGANIVHGTYDAGTTLFSSGSFTFHVPPERWNNGGKLTLAIKPEAIVLDPLMNTTRVESLEAKIIENEYLGYTSSLVVEVKGTRLRATALSSSVVRALKPGEVVTVQFDWSKITPLPQSE
jgi:ABC-type sugar transport system ATPase subunit